LPVKFACNFLELIRLPLKRLILDENLKRVDKISGSCGALVESSDVRSQELSHVFFADERFEVEQKLGALVVLDVGLGGFGSAASHVEVELREARLVLEIRECSVEAEVVDEALNLGSLLPVKFSRNFRLNEYSRTLIEPDVFPGLAGYQVAHPAVNNLVDRCSNLTLVSGDHGR